MWDTFLRQGCRSEINISHSTRAKLNKKFEEAKGRIDLLEVDNLTFDKASKDIFSLMQSDSFERYIYNLQDIYDTYIYIYKYSILYIIFLFRWRGEDKRTIEILLIPILSISISIFIIE